MALSNEIRRLTQGFVAAHGDRIAMTAAIRDNAAQELSGFHAAHESMAAKQRQHLAGGRARLASNVSKMRGDLADYADGLRDNVTETLESLDTAHQDMAAKQRRRLAGGRARLASDVSKMRGDLADYVDGLRDNVAKMCGDLHADRSGARKIWNDFATTMQKRRAKKSGAPSPKAPVTDATQRLAVVGRPPITVAKAPVPHPKEARKPKSRQKRFGKL